jgi:hypothetical protein
MHHDKKMCKFKTKPNQNDECLQALSFNKGGGGDSLSKLSSSFYYYYYQPPWWIYLGPPQKKTKK